MVSSAEERSSVAEESGGYGKRKTEVAEEKNGSRAFRGLRMEERRTFIREDLASMIDLIGYTV